MEIINCFLSKVASNIEETISDEEVREGLFDVALDVFVWWGD